MRDCFISREQAESDVLSCAAFLAERIKSGDGHAEAMSEIVPLYLAKGDVDLAAELSNAVDDPYSRDRLLILVAEKCAETDDDEYAQQLADAIEDHGLKQQAFERIGLVKAAKGETAKAAEIADQMSHPDSVHAAIAVNQAAKGDETASDATLGSIEFASARVFALREIAAGRMEKDDNLRAAEALERAVTGAEEIEHDEEKIRTLCDLGNMFIEAQRSDKAIETFDKAQRHTELLDNTHRDVFLVNCSLGYLFAGSSDLAERTLDLVTDKTQMASALLGFARDHWRKDEKEDAVDALEEAYEILRSQRESETRDSRARNTLMRTIAAQFAGFGKTDRGVEIALENVDPNERIAALSHIAQIQTSRKENDLARQTINIITEDADRVSALISISDVAPRDDANNSLALLDEAAQLAETIPQFSARSEALNAIASRYIEYDQLDKAQTVADENLAVITEIRDETSQAVALAGVAGVLEKVALSDTVKASLQTLVLKTEW